MKLGYAARLLWLGEDCGTRKERVRGREAEGCHSYTCQPARCLPSSNPRKDANRPCDSAAERICLATLGTPRPVRSAYKCSTTEKETLERFSAKPYLLLSW